MCIRLTLLAALALLLPLSPAVAEVRIVTGPTPIRDGNARAATDLTVVNERLAFALAVGTPVPYGVPRGALIDIAPVVHGTIGRDRVVFADFIPNNWSAWPNSYQRVEVLEHGPQQVRIRAVRDFGRVRIETVYTLASGSDSIELSTTMTNEGETALEGLLSGLTLWPSSGFLFAVPGMAGITEGPASAALDRRVTAYDADWTVTLHAPYLDHVGSGSRDLFQLHTLAPHASRSFSGSIQVGARGDLAPVLAAEIATQHLAAGSIHGRVTDRDGRPLAQPVVVVEKAGQAYAWTLGEDGEYRISLPAGDYSLYATGRGYPQSAPVAARVARGTDEQHDFAGLEAPGRVEFTVVDAATRAPRDARIDITRGTRPVVQFLGRRTFFTTLSPRGRIGMPMAPGEYLFSVESGGGVLGPRVTVPVSVPPGATVARTVPVHEEFDPTQRGWYAADLHHHADQAEAVTPPEDLARSQLAAGLDVLFVSDHDSTANHAKLRELAAARGVAFLPGIELSPSWGHFNAYPLTAGAQLRIDTGTATAGEVLREARRMGASVVQVNHPFIPFGYFSSVAAGVAPGGFDGSFDLVEINSSAAADDDKVLKWLWDHWNQGERYYLTAGSDTHDVWNEHSGRVRVYVHPGAPLTPESFAAALKAGHAYVTYGPLIYPRVVFGSELHPPAGRPLQADFELGSVAGLRQASLITDGATRATQQFGAAPVHAHASFTIPAPLPRWYALVVTDQQGRRAYSDPVWLAGTGR